MLWQSLQSELAGKDYVASDDLAMALFLTVTLGKPLLLEGPAGVGKTQIAKTLAELQDTKLIRLQCYEGLDASHAIYEWNYQRQLLSIRAAAEEHQPSAEVEDRIFSEKYLLERPLLAAIRQDKAPVLLIDEIDRADEEFEAYLLELLSVFQVSIPEMHTIKAVHRPYVILTSNRTRELSDALKRRCLYHWVDYPTPEREKRIVRKHLPEIDEQILDQLVRCVQHLRTLDLNKAPGVAETLDWASGLIALGAQQLDGDNMSATLGLVLKTQDDMAQVREGVLEQILEAPE